MKHEPPQGLGDAEQFAKGSTAVFYRVDSGIVMKYPLLPWWDRNATEHAKRIKDKFDVERQILEILGKHPRITEFLGVSPDTRGLYFKEASHGNLQTYIDENNATIDKSLRLKWHRQTIESVKYIHEKDVIHADLRPDNYLLAKDIHGLLEIQLCDFGGAKSGNIDGQQLPDAGFFKPRAPWIATEATDIFSLGSVLYTISTGHWPFRLPGGLFESYDEKMKYESEVDMRFSKGEFPPTENLVSGVIICGCWSGKYKRAKEILE